MQTQTFEPTLPAASRAIIVTEENEGDATQQTFLDVLEHDDDDYEESDGMFSSL